MLPASPAIVETSPAAVIFRPGQSDYVLALDDTRPAFSPGGQIFAFRSSRDQGGLYVMGATGESVRRLTDFGFDPAWWSDGKRVVFATEGVSSPYSRTPTTMSAPE